MGTSVFVVGLFLLVIAVIATLAPVGRIGDLERFTVFVAGAFTCAIGYYMATRSSN
jgi:ABC-type molybdate transport system substrate-binding protein